MCIGTEMNNECQGQDGASWLNSFILSPGKIPWTEMWSQSIAAAQKSLFLWSFLWWMELSVEPWDKRTSHNRWSPINYNAVNRFGNKSGQSFQSDLTSLSTDILVFLFLIHSFALFRGYKKNRTNDCRMSSWCQSSHYTTHVVAMAPLGNAITLMVQHISFSKMSAVTRAANFINFKGQMIVKKGKTK